MKMKSGGTGKESRYAGGYEASMIEQPGVAALATC